MAGISQTLRRASGHLMPLPRAESTVDVKIEGHQHGKVYSSGSALTGTVTICAATELEFDGVDVAFVGLSTTRDFIEPHPQRTIMPFLRLSMPVHESAFPDGNVLVAGKVYTVPFHFVIPSHLAMGQCRHRCDRMSLRDCHLRLPPTMGTDDKNDQSPEAVKILYSVSVTVSKNTGETLRMQVLLSGRQYIRVFPSSSEQAPLDITSCDGRYRLSKTKAVWGSLLRGKTGELVATAAQPRAVMLSADGDMSTESRIHIALEFAPSSAAFAPVKIDHVSARIQCLTFFDVSPLGNTPSLGRWGVPEEGYKAPYEHSVIRKLLDTSVGEVQWTRHTCDGCVSRPRRSSLKPAAAHLEHGRADDDSQYKYTAELSVPFTVPHARDHFFLPSFDSCLISRAYILEVTISVGPTHSKMSLMVPLQVGVEGESSAELDGPVMQQEFLMATSGGNEPPVYSPRPSISWTAESSVSV